MTGAAALPHLLGWYGYAALFAAVALESCGVPVPGEVTLVLAAVDAGAGGGLSLWPVLAVAAAAAVIGDNLGYLLGRYAGRPLARRYGRYVGLPASRLRAGRWLFTRYGGTVVFLGRFAAVLRTYAALLAGLNLMPWRRFAAANAAGGMVWAAIWGIGGYELGSALLRLTGPVGIALASAAGIGLVVLSLWMRAHGKHLVDWAQGATSGPVHPVTRAGEEWDR